MGFLGKTVSDTPKHKVGLTREDLRCELQEFVAESLRAELQIFSNHLQRNVHADVQEMLLELQRSLQRSSHKEPVALSPKSVGASISEPLTRDRAQGTLRDILMESPPEPPTTTELPGAIATESDTGPIGADAAVAAGNDKQMSKCLTREDSKNSLDAPNSPFTDPGSPGTAESLVSQDRSLSKSSKKPRQQISGWKSSRRASNTAADKLMMMAQASTGRHRLVAALSHNYFDYVVASLIMLNGMIVGIQTDYLARHRLEDPPTVFQVIEYLFCVIFTVELALRLFAFRLSFFTMGQRAWNIFDFVIVSLQLVEVFMSIVAAGVGFSFNILRILRLVRVVRLARALRLIGELRTIVASIAGSLKPLFWTGVLLFLVAYVVGVALTQLVHSKRLTLIEDGEHIPAVLDTYWGALISSIFTLIMSITGGVDWDNVCRPLIDKIGVEVGILFTCYILFSSLAMLNVVTGVFIDSVMENGRQLKESRNLEQIQALFLSLDVDHSGEITWEEFEEHLPSQQMKDIFRLAGVDISHARSLFELLDLDDSGSVTPQEFVEGCFRIWSPAKDLDVRMISRDITKLTSLVTEALPSKSRPLQA